ncbi:MAG: PhoH family protein [Phycisphaerae bacterium]
MLLTLEIEPDARVALFGAADRHLKALRSAFDVHFSARGGELRLSGEPSAVEQAAIALADMRRMLRMHPGLSVQMVQDAIRTARHHHKTGKSDSGEMMDVATGAGPVQPRTEGQKRYIEAMLRHDLVFCSGPAGTGKTFLAVAFAVSLLRRGAVRRLVLVRPAVEAGEKLGFLPGDVQAKVNPYLRPLLDALHDLMPFEQIRRFMANDVIELAPLAYMRGRTLNEAIVILDEAQNTTPSQMLMFLTRLGSSGKMIVTGDPSQVDLEAGQVSGLRDAGSKLRRMRGVAFVELQKSDIVRHQLVQQIVQAYERPGSHGRRATSDAAVVADASAGHPMASPAGHGETSLGLAT